MSLCGSNPKEHCCWVKGTPCRYLKTTTQRVRAEKGLYWKCKLREELGSWEAVHTDPRYVKHIKVRWGEIGMEDCGEYPKSGKVCNVCGNVGKAD